VTPRVANFVAVALAATLLLGCSMGAGNGVTVGRSTATPSVTPTATLAPASATPAATPANSLATPGKLAALHIEADANPPAGEDCERLFPFAMTSSSPSAPGRAVECAFGKTFEPARYLFAAGADGALYLERVQLLVLGKATLPSPYRESACKDIRDHLWPASEQADKATSTVVCWQVPPLPSGTAGGSNVIWGAVPQDASRITFPERTFCWQLVPYLGARSDVRTVPVPCVLD